MLLIQALVQQRLHSLSSVHICRQTHPNCIDCHCFHVLLVSAKRCQLRLLFNAFPLMPFSDVLENLTHSTRATVVVRGFMVCMQTNKRLKSFMVDVSPN